MVVRMESNFCLEVSVFAIKMLKKTTTISNTVSKWRKHFLRQLNNYLKCKLLNAG